MGLTHIFEAESLDIDDRQAKPLKIFFCILQPPQTRPSFNNLVTNEGQSLDIYIYEFCSAGPRLEGGTLTFSRGVGPVDNSPPTN